ncbi:MAG: DegQ family serine endoprotease [Gemmatimonas sp.]
MAVAGLLFAAPAVPAQARGPEGFGDLADRLLPAVVNISSTQVSRERAQRGPDIPQFPPGSPFEEFFRDFLDRNRPDAPPRRVTSLGSGFIIDPSGYVVTNNHVIDDAEEITVILQDNTNLKAKLVGKDSKTDIALLKVDTDKKLPSVKFGDSDKTRVGDWIIAIGNPFGLGGTVTAGIISARARDINSGPYDDYLQTDASINTGNSGGPMFNMDGDVIGVNTAILSPSGGSIGIGFAIPSRLVMTVVDQLREFGVTKRGWLGVRIQTVTDDIAENLGLNKARGALVAGTTEGGPAEKAGIEAGDVITKFDGKDVPDMRRLPRIVAETPIEKEVPVEVWRKGKSTQVKVKVGELKEEEAQAKDESAPAPEATPRDTTTVLGLTLSSLTPALRDRYKLDPNVKGVIITQVANDSPARGQGLTPGDVILEAASKKVSAPKEVQAAVEDAKSKKRKSVLLMVEGRNGQNFVVLPLEARR